MEKKSKSDREIIVVGIVSYVIGLEKGKGEAIQVVDEGEIPNLVDNPYTLVINAYEISNPDKKITVVHNSNSKEVEVKIDEKNFTVPKFSSIIVKEGKNLL